MTFLLLNWRLRSTHQGKRSSLFNLEKVDMHPRTVTYLGVIHQEWRLLSVWTGLLNKKIRRGLGVTWILCTRRICVSGRYRCRAGGDIIRLVNSHYVGLFRRHRPVDSIERQSTIFRCVERRRRWQSACVAPFTLVDFRACEVLSRMLLILLLLVDHRRTLREIAVDLLFLLIGTNEVFLVVARHYGQVQFIILIRRGIRWWDRQMMKMMMVMMVGLLVDHRAILMQGTDDSWNVTCLSIRFHADVKPWTSREHGSDDRT